MLKVISNKTNLGLKKKCMIGLFKITPKKASLSNARNQCTIQGML